MSQTKSVYEQQKRTAKRLEHYEQVIRQGIKTFHKVGEALLAIRDERLYRKLLGYPTFEAYCQSRWGFSRQHAYRLIGAHEVVSNLSPIGDSPRNEAQTRPLISLTPEQQQKAWLRAKKIAGKEAVTFGHVQKAIAEVDRSTNVHYSSHNIEWYTPQSIIEAVLQVFGEIDLDPCSNDRKSPNVPAKRYFTVEDDGLKQDWQGRVYCNPPYGDEIKHWVKKMTGEHDAEHSSATIALLPARTDTHWFRSLRNFPRCFLTGRLRFSGSKNSAPFPSMVVYLGNHLSVFKQVFEKAGDVYVRAYSIKNSTIDKGVS